MQYAPSGSTDTAPDAGETAAPDLSAVLKEAKEGYAKAEERDQHNRVAMLEDINFRAGEQWHATDKAKREKAERPTLTINQTPVIVNQVIGDIRKNQPSIQCTPGDGAANASAALVFEGLIRSIERQCSAHDTYIGAAEQAVIGGIGHWRLRLDWAAPDSFDLDVKIEHIPDPFAVLRDAPGMRGNGADAKRTWVYEEISCEEFEERFPDATPSNWAVSQPVSQQSRQTTSKPKTVTLCEYWRVEEDAVELVKVVHDQAWFDDYGRPQPPTGAEAVLHSPTMEERALMRRQGWSEVARRPGKKRRIVAYLLGGDSVLAGPVEWPGQRIPIFSVKGQEIAMGAGVVMRHGLIRFCKDAQRLYNYARSADAETYGLTAKVPFIIAAEQIAGYESEWELANKSPRPYLRYNLQRDEDGQVINAPKPGREPPVGTNPALMAMAASAQEDIRATTGIYAVNVGAPSSEKSGVAIDARDRQADTGTFVYVDNLLSTIEATGRELINLIPIFYSARRQIRILGRDDVAAIVELEREGIDLNRGRYDIIVQTGPAHATARKEAAEGMLEMAKIVEPPFRVPLITRVAKAQDWHDAETLAQEFQQIAAAMGMPGAAPAPGAPGAVPGAPALPGGPQPAAPSPMAPPAAPGAMAAGPGGVPNIPGIQLPPELLARIPLSPGAAPAGPGRVAPNGARA